MVYFRKFLLVVLLVMLISGCATTTLESKSYKSYVIGQTVTANVGAAFLTDQNGTVKKVKHWVGLVNSSDGWKIDKVVSPDFVRKELIYSGKEGNTIDISYREFRGGLAAPAFYQTLKYDLNESHKIAFQNFRLFVIKATNSFIRIKILSDK